MWRLLIVLLSLGFSGASEANDFYKGKTLTIYTNNGAGSNPDLIARTFAKHLRKFIEGNPTVVVASTLGAQGSIAPNYLNQVAANDGTNIGYFTNILVAKYLDDNLNNLSFDPTKAIILFRMPREVLTVATNKLPGDIKFIIDNNIRVNFGINGAPSGQNIAQIMSFEVLGINAKTISGYKTNNEVLLAIERGELDFGVTTQFSYSKRTKPDALIPVWTTTNSGQHTIALSIDALYRDIYGRSPSGVKWDSYKFIEDLQDQQLIMLGNSPKVAIDAMKIAIEKIARSTEFAADLSIITGDNPVYLFGKEAEDSITSIKATPEVLSYIKQYMINE